MFYSMACQVISYSLEELYTGGLVCLLMCYYRVVYVIVIASSYRLGVAYGYSRWILGMM